jgi:hypothetical protein
VSGVLECDRLFWSVDRQGLLCIFMDGLLQRMKWYW